MDPQDYHPVARLLREGIAAARSGRPEEARDRLMEVIALDESNEQAWLWLSGVVASDEDRLVCLDNVLTLNPYNAQARAGLRWLHDRGVNSDRNDRALGSPDPAATPDPTQETPLQSKQADFEREGFLTTEGCVFCGSLVPESALRCSCCGRQLVTKQFETTERSFMGYLLHVYWVILAGINLIDAFLIGYIYRTIDDLPGLIQRYMPYIVGPIITRRAELNPVVELDKLIWAVQLYLCALALCCIIVAGGLFLRRPRAHSIGIALIALHLLTGVALFFIGLLGYLMAAIRALITLMLTVYMFNTVEDFAKREHRQRLVLDRHLVTATDYYARGRVYARRGMWAKALLHWRRATAIDPQRAEYYAAVARAFAGLGRYDQALAQIDEALRLSRAPGEIQALRGLILQAQEQVAAQNLIHE